MRDFVGYLLKRLGWMLLTLWIVYTVSFVLMKSVPGNPFSGERNVPPAIERQLRARYNLDAPPVQQYFDYLTGIVTRLDLGWCLGLEDYSVNDVIAEGFPISAALAIFALVFAVSLGITAGVVSAVYRGTFADVSMMGAAVLGIAIPNFVLASLAILVFVFGIQIFPAGGWGTLKQIFLPALCFGRTRRSLHRKTDKSRHARNAQQRACPYCICKRAAKTDRDFTARFAGRASACCFFPGSCNCKSPDRVFGIGKNLRLARHGKPLHQRSHTARLSTCDGHGSDVHGHLVHDEHHRRHLLRHH